jgi:indole-3-glycerol phosphate synthase
MASFLDRMAAGSRARADDAHRREPVVRLLERARTSPEPLPLRLTGFDLIAELKHRSPAAGGLAPAGFDVERQLEAYAAGGAAAVSVLTEPTEFHGSLEQLESAAAQLRPLGCPVMRKDFLVDSYQVVEARAAGASGVLLIAAMLSDAGLDELVAAAAELGLFVLLEAFDSDDLARLARLKLPTVVPAVEPTAGPTALIGLNSRDLRTLAVDFNRFRALAGELRHDLPAVAESGIANPADIETVAALGYRLALVGSALMRDGEPERAVADLLAAGRRTATPGAACS